jgi:hypothetical protein
MIDGERLGRALGSSEREMESEPALTPLQPREFFGTRLVAADRIRLTYDDMPGGTEIQLYTDGFAFAPYRMLVVIPFLPIPLQILAHDSCSWDSASHELRDTINVSLIGLPLGRQVTRLRPEPGHSTSRTNF